MVQNIEVCNPTIKTDNIFDFLHKHLDCDCIVNTQHELTKNEVEILAYARTTAGNKQLAEYYEKKEYSSPIIIIQGISQMEVDCIDYVVV